MIGIPLGWAYSNFGEWVLHKYVLHGLGKHRGSFWSFHWHEHHQKSPRHDMVDDQYMRSLWSWSARTKELLSLAVLAVAHAPLFPVAPFFVGTVWACTVNYYRVHRRAHLEVRSLEHRHGPAHGRLVPLHVARRENCRCNDQLLGRVYR